MKKLLTAFVTAALLTVCLCVPAFAADSAFCGCNFDDGLVLLYSVDDHFIFCTVHHWLGKIDGINPVDPVPHTDDCSFCAGVGDNVTIVPYEYYSSGALTGECQTLASLLDVGVVPGLAFAYDDADHYFYCVDCGSFLSMSAFDGAAVPHVTPDCEMCSYMSSNGLPIHGALSVPASGVLPSITTLVTASINWLSAFALCILSTPLFLIFVCCIFVGLGIGLIKRSIRL